MTNALQKKTRKNLTVFLGRKEEQGTQVLELSPSLVCYTAFWRRWGRRRWWAGRSVVVLHVLVKRLLHIVFKFREAHLLGFLLFWSTLIKEECIRHIIIQKLVNHFRAMREIVPTCLHCHQIKFSKRIKQLVFIQILTYAYLLQVAFDY